MIILKTETGLYQITMFEIRYTHVTDQIKIAAMCPNSKYTFYGNREYGSTEGPISKENAATERLEWLLKNCMVGCLPNTITLEDF